MEVATYIIMVFTIAMFFLVFSSLIYAKVTYTQNIKNSKFNITYQFYKDFKHNYFNHFDEIIRADEGRIKVNKAELWFKARELSKFFSYLGQLVKIKLLDLENIFYFFNEYLFDKNTFLKLIDKINKIYSGTEWDNSEKLLSGARDNFNFLMNEIAKTDVELSEFKDLVRNKIPALHKQYISGSIRIIGEISLNSKNKEK